MKEAMQLSRLRQEFILHFGEMGAMIELMTDWYDEMNKLETEKLVALLRMGARLKKMIDAAGDVLPLSNRTKG